MYSEEDRRFAVDLYFEMCSHMSQDTFVAELGYPTRACLANWIKQDHRFDHDTFSCRSAPIKVKIEAVMMYEDGTGADTIAKKFGIASPTSVYHWVRSYRRAGTRGLLPKRIGGGGMDAEDHNSPKKEPQPPKKPPTQTEDLFTQRDALSDNPDELKDMIKDLQLRLAVSEESLAVLKGDARADAGTMTNREKTEIVCRLQDRFDLRELFEAVGLAKSTYYYNLEALTRPDRLALTRVRITNIFESSEQTWGAERIWAALRSGIDGLPPKKISEKVVRRLMVEQGCVVAYAKKRRRTWSSYAGEPTQAPKNLAERRFKSEKPNKLWLTDITEFKLPNEQKVYLSAIIDCFDGRPVAWKSGLHPDAELANATLRDACLQLQAHDRPVGHSDRGGHYRWPGWIDLCKKYKITRSMSAKGCSPDNAAMEGFFGRLKNEFFYYRNWSGVSSDEFMERLDAYLRYYCESRIKKTLGWMSPNEYRRSKGYAA